MLCGYLLDEHFGLSVVADLEEVGRQGLTPPATVRNPAAWKGRSDDEVITACQQDLNLTACYVAGTRGLSLED